MLDQSFSSKSFQEIFDNENRKGINVEAKKTSGINISITKNREKNTILTKQLFRFKKQPKMINEVITPENIFSRVKCFFGVFVKIL